MSELTQLCTRYNIDVDDVVYYFKLRNGEPRIILKDDFNDVYGCLLDETARIQLIFGGRGSGKSKHIVRQIVADTYSGHNWLVCRYYKVDLRNSCFNEILEVIDDWGLTDEFSVDKSTMTITCLHNSRQIIFGALEEPRRLKSLKPKKGILTDIFMEEGDECPSYEAFETLDNCLRGIDSDAKRRGLPQPRKRIMLAFNPFPETHWLYKVFFEKLWHHPDVKSIDELKSLTLKDKTARGTVEGAEVFILKTTYADNRFLTEEDISKRENSTGQRLWVDTLGNFGRLGATVFKRGEHWSIADLSGRDFRNIRVGSDFGYNHPCAFVKCSLDKANHKIYVFDELFVNEVTTRQYGELIYKKALGHAVYCDAAEPDRIKELKEMGIRADKCKKGKAKGTKSAISRRIDWLHDYEIIIDQKCVNLIGEFKVYRWKVDSAGQILDIPEDADNHGIDALSYALGYDIFAGTKISGGGKLF